jgi:hypothetical protein
MNRSVFSWSPHWLEASGHVHAPSTLPLGIGGWVGSRAGLDDIEKWTLLTLQRFKLRPLGRRTCSQSLYLLRYCCPQKRRYRSQIDITTDGHSSTLLCCRAPSAAQGQIFITAIQCGFIDVVLPLWREDGSVVTTAAGPRQHNYSLVRVPRKSWTEIRDCLNLEEKFPVFLSPRSNVVQIYPQELGSFSSLPTTLVAAMNTIEPAFIWALW